MSGSAVSPSARRSVALAAFAFSAAVLAGTGARAGTADWGLPFALHVDERGFVVHEALGTEWRGLRRGDWTPRINTYGSAVIFGVIGVHWATQGGRERAAAVARRYPNEYEYIHRGFGFEGESSFSMPALLHSLRLVSAVLGGLAILFVGLAGWRLAGHWAGVATAWLAAFTVGLLQVGHFYTAEALMLMPQAVFLHACTHLRTGRRWAWVGVAGVALGTVAATKMPGLAIAGALPACLLPSVARLRTRHVVRVLRSPALWAVPLVALVVYRFANPFPFEHPELYFDAVAGNRDGATVLAEQYVPRSFGFLDWRTPWNDTVSYLYTLRSVLPAGAGWPLVGGTVLALGAGIRLRRPQDRVAWLAIVPTFVLVGAWAVQTVRYGLPAYLPLTLAVGALVVRSRRRAIRVAAAALVVVPTVAHGIAFTAMFAETDPRVRGAQWIAERVEPGDVVVLEHEETYTVPLNTRGSSLGWSSGLQTPASVRHLWRRPSARPLEAALAQLEGARFLVTSEWYERRAERALEGDLHAEFYRQLFAGELPFDEVAHFDPDPRLGPLHWSEAGMDPMALCFDHCAVRVWARRSEPADEP